MDLSQLVTPTRISAMNWWNNLLSIQKTHICDTSPNLIGNCRRWETLTGREIEIIYEQLQKSRDEK